MITPICLEVLPQWWQKMSKKVLLKKLIKFTGKHLTRVFFNKAAGSWKLLYFSFAQTVILKIGNAANLKEIGLAFWYKNDYLGARRTFTSFQSSKYITF